MFLKTDSRMNKWDLISRDHHDHTKNHHRVDPVVEHWAMNYFVDFKKAFDSEDQDVLSKIMWHYRVPEKIVKIIWNFHKGFLVRVVHEGDMTEPFCMNSGVHQCYMLRHLQFLIALNWGLNKPLETARPGPNLFSLLEKLNFADDMILLSQKITHM